MSNTEIAIYLWVLTVVVIALVICVGWIGLRSPTDKGKISIERLPNTVATKYTIDLMNLEINSIMKDVEDRLTSFKRELEDDSPDLDDDWELRGLENDIESLERGMDDLRREYQEFIEAVINGMTGGNDD